MSKPIVIVAPMPENANGSKFHNWRARDAARQKYFKRLDDMQGAGLIPEPPPRPLEKVTVRSIMRLGNGMDDDNAATRHKTLLDWLKSRGYIVDDRRSCLRWEAFPEQVVKRDGRYTITLTITPAAA